MDTSPLIERRRERTYYTMEETNAEISINRRVLMQTEVTESIEEPSSKRKRIFSKLVKSCKPKKCLSKTVPIVGWLSTYNWKEWLIKDAIAGFTVAIMNIPQGMAYALLGNVPPVVGIYMAFIPVIVYSCLGTSRHISMGAFAVVCLMCGNVVAKYTPGYHGYNVDNSTVQYTAIEVGTAVSFMVGIYQLVLYLLRLGIVCTLLSETLVSGFTAGAAVHVLTSQIKEVLGLSRPSLSGPFNLIYVYIDIFENLNLVNTAALIISSIIIVILLINSEVFKPLLQKKTNFPVPIELIVVLTGTLLSHYAHIATTYNLKVVGHISKGLPPLDVPRFDLFPSIAVDSAIIAIIAYVVSLSMALIFANKMKYEVDANQELLAQGTANMVGSFFSCLPIAASLSRSAIQASVGCVTQLTSIINSLILVVVLLWIGPFFEVLPRCFLASLIIVALKGILLQAMDIFKIWKVSICDGIIWLSTYITVILIEIEYGLFIGICVSMLILILRGAQSNVMTLGRLPNSELYVELDKSTKTENLPGVFIVQYSGCLNFLNRMFFKNKILKLINTDSTLNNNQEANKMSSISETVQDVIILDFKSLTYMDPSGAECLKSLIFDFQRVNKAVYLVGLSGTTLEVLRICNVIQQTSAPIFPSVHDAVMYAQSNQSTSCNIRL